MACHITIFDEKSVTGEAIDAIRIFMLSARNNNHGRNNSWNVSPLVNSEENLLMESPDE